MQIVPLPPPAELEKLLSGLLMRSVKVAKGGEPPGGLLASAVFAAPDPLQEVLVVCELPLAASLAAALSVVPPLVVKECLASGAMDESLQDNFGEVMNVLSRFISGSGRSYRLGQVTAPPTPLAEERVKAADDTDEKRDFTVEVPGYGAGRLAFWTL